MKRNNPGKETNQVWKSAWMQNVGEKQAIIWGLMKWAKEWSNSTEPKYIDCEKKKGCKQLRKKYIFLHGLKN